MSGSGLEHRDHVSSSRLRSKGGKVGGKESDLALQGVWCMPVHSLGVFCIGMLCLSKGLRLISTGAGQGKMVWGKFCSSLFWQSLYQFVKYVADMYGTHKDVHEARP